MKRIKTVLVDIPLEEEFHGSEFVEQILNNTSCGEHLAAFFASIEQHKSDMFCDIAEEVRNTPDDRKDEQIKKWQGPLSLSPMCTL